MEAPEVAALAARHGFSAEATDVALRALRMGHGRMAQFSHPEFGGLGQWSPGMTMIGAMFDGALRARVETLFSELAEHVRSLPAVAQGAGLDSGGAWWPAELGVPSSSGAQNDMRYALFPNQSRLAVERGGRVIVYDTGSHRVSGFGQQSGGSLSLSGENGPIPLERLTIVGEPDMRPERAPEPSVPAEASRPTPSHAGVPVASGDPLALLERLADLHRRGIVSEVEFNAKKAELLSRV